MSIKIKNVLRSNGITTSVEQNSFLAFTSYSENLKSARILRRVDS